jgi:hypothetical protein
MEAGLYPGHTGGRVLCVSLCGELVLSCGDAPYVVLLWRASNLALVQRFIGHSGPVTQALMSGDKMVSCSDDGSVRVWDTASGAELIKRMSGHRVSGVIEVGDGLAWTSESAGTRIAATHHAVSGKCIAAVGSRVFVGDGLGRVRGVKPSGEWESVGEFDHGVFCMAAFGTEYLFCGLRRDGIVRIRISHGVICSTVGASPACTSLAVSGRVLVAGFDEGWVQMFWADGNMVPFRTLRLVVPTMVRAIDVSVERNCVVLGTYSGRVMLMPLFASLAYLCALALPDSQLTRLPDDLRDFCVKAKAVQKLFVRTTAL